MAGEGVRSWNPPPRPPYSFAGNVKVKQLLGQQNSVLETFKKESPRDTEIPLLPVSRVSKGICTPVFIQKGSPQTKGATKR